MRPLRLAGLGLALVALAAAGAAVALLLLSTIGGTPEHDPVGRLRPVLPGRPPPTVVVPPSPGVTDPATQPHDGDDDGDDD
jgi:hypothetical protein